jgi:hypothetical protein
MAHGETDAIEDHPVSEGKRDILKFNGVVEIPHRSSALARGFFSD